MSKRIYIRILFEAHVIFSPSNTANLNEPSGLWFEAHVIFSPSNTVLIDELPNIVFEAHVIFSPSNTLKSITTQQYKV